MTDNSPNCVSVDPTDSESSIFSDLELSGYFIRIPVEVNELVLREGLTAAEFKLWHWLLRFDPYGDRNRPLPNPTELSQILGVSRQTIYSASARLEELGLYCFTVEQWSGRNPFGYKASKFRDKPAIDGTEECKRDSTSVKKTRKQPKKLDSEQINLTGTSLEGNRSRRSRALKIFKQDLKKERERERSDKNSFSIDLQSQPKAIEPEAPLDLPGTPIQVVVPETITDPPSPANLPVEDQTSPRPTHTSSESSPVPFDPLTCNWSEYSGPGFGGSPQAFYRYTRACMEQYNNSPQRKGKPIENLDAYTIRCIQTKGIDAYMEWEKKGRPTQPDRKVAPPANPTSSATSSAPPTATPEPCQNGSGRLFTAPPDFAPPITIEQLLENRRKALENLFQGRRFDAMRSYLEQWMQYESAMVRDLLTANPHWGFEARGREVFHRPLSLSSGGRR